MVASDDDLLLPRIPIHDARSHVEDEVCAIIVAFGDAVVPAVVALGVVLALLLLWGHLSLLISPRSMLIHFVVIVMVNAIVVSTRFN